MKRKLDINAKSRRTTRRATLTTGGHSWVGSMYWCIHHWPLPYSCGHRMCYAPGAWLSGMQYRTRLRLSTILNALQLLISPVSDCNESLPSHTAYLKILTSAVNRILFSPTNYFFFFITCWLTFVVITYRLVLTQSNGSYSCNPLWSNLNCCSFLNMYCTAIDVVEAHVMVSTHRNLIY